MWSNVFSFVPIVTFKPLTVLLSSIALNVTAVASVASWTIIHPMLWVDLGFGSWENIYIQFNTMGIHTFPLLCSLINYALLTDAPIYMQDLLATYFIIIIYIIWNYIYYSMTGTVQYVFMDWANPEAYWAIVLFVITMFTGVTINNVTIALLSQFV